MRAHMWVCVYVRVGVYVCVSERDCNKIRDKDRETLES